MQREQAASAGQTLLVDLCSVESVDVQRLAFAYELSYQDAGNEDKKMTLRIMRDALLLKVCGGRGPWSNESLTEEMESVAAFGHVLPPLLQSQLLNSFNKIMQLGKDRAAWDAAVSDNIYGRAMAPDEADDLFTTWAEFTLRFPNFKSHTRLNGRRRTRPKSRKDNGQGSAESDDESFGVPPGLSLPDGAGSSTEISRVPPGLRLPDEAESSTDCFSQ